ncbi:MAG: MmgE/PrpD family protein [Sphingomonadales bacterium]|nr:MmgE/PrpD family protein [Sphingomonadales bacterium]
MTELSPAQVIGQFSADVRLEEVPAAVVARAKLHILDALGLGLAATVEEFGVTSRAGVAAMAAPGACSTILGKDGWAPRDAAMLNAILMHGLDFDDTHLGSIIHPTCTALPAALALAEEHDLSGAELLAGFLVGAELGIRIGGAVKGGFHHVGYHATGVVSHFASAVTAGRLLGLTAEQITAAQGITGSTAAGIQVFLEEGAWTKRFHPGWGAAAGITAAHLAKAGFKGPTRPYEGKFGLFDTHLQSHAGEVDLGELTAGLGDEWRFGDTALKPYPVCHFIHGCADAAIELHREIGGVEIVAVDAYLAQPTLHIVCEPAEAKERPGTDYEAKFSAQFVTAWCLLYGRFGLPDLLPAALADERARALAVKVKCHADPDTNFPTTFSGGVTVTLADGRVLKRHVRVNSGAGEKAMSEAQVVAKFDACASLAVDARRAARVREAVLGLEGISARELAAALRG